MAVITITGKMIAVREDGEDLHVQAIHENEIPEHISLKLGPRWGTCSVFYKIDPSSGKKVGVGCNRESCTGDSDCELSTNNYGGQTYYYCDCLMV
jgi:hypothetical protein